MDNELEYQSSGERNVSINRPLLEEYESQEDIIEKMMMKTKKKIKLNNQHRQKVKSHRIKINIRKINFTLHCYCIKDVN